ncbi:unnamed protein product [Danaus chrysippus]|uniref:Sterol regulatory element-binding protein cleavage-activating protein n=1 Tax=Danaus chrysippus TaxID=151541 RepID=A0A8J2Q9U4_9NEOP|nr:unnamed protein product [Danaus chrysippus]
MAGSTLPEKVAQIYYTYGLFCSSYPAVAIALALSVVLFCCYPLLNVPLPGNIPVVINIHNKDQHKVVDCNTNCDFSATSLQLQFLHNETQKLPHVWVKDKPLLYVHQIIMRIGVSPWNNNLKMWDAFRAPLQETFRLLEAVRNHEDPETKETLLQHCYQVEGIKRSDKATVETVLPEYSCLILSPANLWQQNIDSFSLDTNIVNTVYTYQGLQKGKVSIAEMAFGLQLRDTGIKRYPLRARPRVLQYAVTLFYQHADEKFINSLTKKLRDMYPLYQDTSQAYTDEMTLIYYPGKFNYHELVQLMITFVGLFLYVYFSVRKIEFIKSKLGLAACAVLSIAGSLTMSMGICFFFGFSLSLQGKEIFPYLVIIVGLENVLVLTKSVTSTDSRLDVKIRLAQGLSKEGWSITKNLLTEITILTVSFFTFVPFIQEFSIFMIVSLLTDYFIQMVFFATILGIDVRRMEFYPERNSKLHLKDYFNSNNALNWRFHRGYSDDNNSPQRMTKSKSHPRLNGLVQTSPTDVVAQRNQSPGCQDHRVPKRIWLVNMWARTRFFQRAFMVWMLVWISMIVYDSGVVDYFIGSVENSEINTVHRKNIRNEPKQSVYMIYNNVNNTGRHPLVFSPLLDTSDTEKIAIAANETILLKHSPLHRPFSRVSPYHWSSILSQYNESVAGRYVAILPPVLVSHRVGPEVAVGLRHPDEKDPPPLRWQALAAALDPIDTLPEFDLKDGKAQAHQLGQGADLPIYPTTPMEILLLAILCTISVAVIAYMMVVLYRCVCSRHYAEWRASWNDDNLHNKTIAKQPAVQLVMEAVPLVVAGHSQEVECLVTDGEKVVSSCLQGNIRVWDSLNGDLITNIDRSAYFKLQSELFDRVNSKASDEHITIEACHSLEDVTQKQNTGPRLRRPLSTHLSNLQFKQNNSTDSTYLPVSESTKYDFAKAYRDLYRTEQDIYDVSDNYSGLIKDNEDISAVKPKTKSAVNSVSMDFVRSDGSDNTGACWRGQVLMDTPVWCMDFCNDLIILGCADGRLEFWEASTGKLMCVYQSSMAGISHVRVLSSGRRVLAASLTGHLSLLRLDACTSSGAHVDWRFSTAHRRTHKRTGSAELLRTGSGFNENRKSFSYDADNNNDEVVCVRVAHCRAHQQPITELQSEGGRVLTGGQDHVLKVFSSSELTALLTLHGHCGPITSCFIDHATPTIAGSGSQDGLLCVWDLHTGACLYSMQAHDGAVTSLAYTASYVVSAGADERLCIWDRFQGHMLNTVHIGLNYMSRMLPLTHTLLVMGDRSGLTAYDLSSGDIIRRVMFVTGQSDGCIFVRQILPLKDAIVCDYANQLRIVRFPLVSKMDMKNE